MSKRKCSSGHNNDIYKYLIGIPENERTHPPKIVRGPVIKAHWGHQWTQIIERNGKTVLWDSRNQQKP